MRITIHDVEVEMCVACWRRWQYGVGESAHVMPLIPHGDRREIITTNVPDYITQSDSISPVEFRKLYQGQFIDDDDGYGGG